MFEDHEKIMIVYDIYLGGELLDELATIGPFQEEDAALLMNHLLGCISYCHQSNVVHRDIKPGTYYSAFHTLHYYCFASSHLHLYAFIYTCMLTVIELLF